MQTVRNSFISSFNNIVRLAAFLLLVILIILMLEMFFQNSDSVTGRKKQIFALEKNSIDIMIFGNSHAYCSFDPDVMLQKLDGNIINAGLPDQKIDVTYYTLKELLTRQNPKIIVLEGFVFGRSHGDYQGYLANVDSLYPGIDKIRACFEIFPDKFEAMSMCTRLYRCHNNWKKPVLVKRNIKELLGLARPDASKFNKGFYVLKDGMTEETIKKYKETIEFKSSFKIDEYSIGYFQRIADLCEEKGIKLILTMSPMNEILNKKVDYASISRKLSSLCKANKVDYLDFNLLYNELGLTFDDFENIVHYAQHLNERGAAKVSSYLADYLKKGIYVKG